MDLNQVRRRAALLTCNSIDKRQTSHVLESNQEGLVRGQFCENAQVFRKKLEGFHLFPIIPGAGKVGAEVLCDFHHTLHGFEHHLQSRLVVEQSLFIHERLICGRPLLG